MPDHAASDNSDDAPTQSYRPDPDATPSFQPLATPTPTQLTPDGYRPPTAPNQTLPDDYDPPRGERFLTPLFHRKGGMGRVFVASDREFARRVALKDIQPKHRDFHWYRHKFVFEAEITGELEHPGIVPVYSLHRPSVSTEHPHYAMRFIEGETLTSAITRFHGGASRESLSFDEFTSLRQLLGRFLSVCQTIAYAHSRGIIHRDLKPDNIMLGPFGETLVVDWGLAKRLTSGESAEPIPNAHSTVVSVGGGTPSYWSPEQANRQAEHQNEKTDVYGLGAVLYAILTGRPPHPKGHHDSTPPHPRAVSRWIDDELDGIVVRALALDPAERFASALELSAAVERWLADQPVSAQRATVANYRTRSEQNPHDLILLEQYIRQLIGLGQVYTGMGRDLDAIEQFQLAITLFQKLRFQRPDVLRYAAEQANVRLILADALTRLKRHESAREQLSIATEVYDELKTEAPKDYRFNYATIHLTSANIRELIQQNPAPVAPEDASELTWVPEEAADSLPLAAPGNVTTDVERSTSPEAPDQDPITVHPEANDPSYAEFIDDGVVLKDQIPGYIILKKLGSGGMAEVWLARDRELGRLVAIKSLRMSNPRNEMAIERFRREAMIVANLDHSNIIRIISSAWTDNQSYPYHVYEYIDGPSLREVVLQFHDRKEKLDRSNSAFRSLLKLIIQVCHALEHAHQRGVIHRDPKPQNILIRGEHAIVYDWGISRVQWLKEIPTNPHERWRYQAEDPELTQEGAAIGTPAFMSPELITNASMADARSDIYCLGSTLYFLLTGQSPRAEKGTAEIIMATLNGPDPRPRTVRNDVPKALDVICSKCLKRKMEDRYQSMSELAADLTDWLQKRSIW